ncbi:MAG TPA: coproporphyrinogen dehydrogenase HemZ [Candidatus Eisenbergiella merdipullorum]|uniref:Coproporphyrinogen dehydrogenase HemZ n=1 Tax=Candidatus Eisenbergiella merdipullorum TaxID=2838553 RepID=A0A9D2I621_9FIRM|nr:coproporphyrinogen dehydrogenase HemZ [Candidatus Eisenbergiella merdipullorum]
MLAVTLNQIRFEYDIHSLVKAFYPSETVKVFLEGTKDLVSDGENPKIAVIFEEDRIRIRVDDLEDTVTLSRPDEKNVVKNELKQLLYRMLSKKTGKLLPWGSLTGIRPAKIAMQLLEEGKTREEILFYMENTYFCSPEKAELAIGIASREKEILKDIHYEQGYSLYIGIPFCPTTCLYCSFTSFPIAAWKDRVEEYLGALEKEMDFVKKACSGRVLDSVYIGGGTPTTLEPDQLRRLLSRIRGTFDFSQVKEFTVEAGRADSITAEKLRVLKEFGVTRISVNPQTMNQKTLDLIGRKTTVEQVKEAFWLARQEGFDNINMDLILGLPGEDIPEVSHTMEEIRKLSPDSLTVHSLAVKKASRMMQWIEKNGMGLLHNTEETMQLAARTAKEMDLHPYYLYRQKNMTGNLENVGYARDGCYGLYNILIMEEKQTIMAIGAGTISKAVHPDGRIERCENVKELPLYLEKLGEMIDRKRRLLGLESDF